MNKSSEYKSFSQHIIFPLFFVFLIWLPYWIEITFGCDFTEYGVFPRKTFGLRGILFSPFIHGDFMHVFNNSIPLFILTAFLFYHYKQVAWKVLLPGFLMTGIGTWILGRPSYHIGISGINYMLISFLFFSGLIIKYYRLIAVSLIVVFLYGGLVWFMFPVIDYISWEGHLSGFISGLVLALVFGKNLKHQYKKDKTVKIYPEDEDFLKQFDENGNFIENEQKNQ